MRARNNSPWPGNYRFPVPDPAPTWTGPPQPSSRQAAAPPAQPPPDAAGQAGHGRSCRVGGAARLMSEGVWEEGGAGMLAGRDQEPGRARGRGRRAGRDQRVNPVAGVHSSARSSIFIPGRAPRAPPPFLPPTRLGPARHKASAAPCFTPSFTPLFR